MMDEIEFLVQETFRVHAAGTFHGQELEREEKNLEEMKPASPQAIAGLLYHVQCHQDIFTVRCVVSDRLDRDYAHALEFPEEWPVLRLVSEGAPATTSLSWFPTETVEQAEILRELLMHRRFPLYEERVCNVSDPGFSWWLLLEENGFVVTTKMAWISEQAIKLGPLGDQAMASMVFKKFAETLATFSLPLDVQVESQRFRFSSDGERLLLDELQGLFELGTVGDDLKAAFALIAHRAGSSSTETVWYFLQELALARRLWIQLFYQLGHETRE